jgi:hypothetical protein
MSNRNDILNSIDVERERQDVMWGTKFDDKNTPNDWVAYIVRYASDAAYDGNGGWYNVDRYKLQLLKCATLCVAALESCERLDGNLAKRHYDE